MVYVWITNITGKVVSLYTHYRWRWCI